MLSTLSKVPDVGEIFLRGAEAAHQVGSSQQLFIWTRLHLHRFVPHELALLSLAGDRADATRQVLVYNCVPLAPAVLGRLADPGERLWHAMADQWARQGGQACWMDLPAGMPGADALAEAGFGRLLVHGLGALGRGGRGGAPELTVAFLQRGDAEPSDPDHARLALDLWLPALFFALLRCQGLGTGQPPAPRAASGMVRALTARELQVLAAVREAKANAQIAVMLGISPLTVKNHLRSIQRKLGARNRVHAVAEAMAMRLIY